jgi:hypothetical protein
MSEPASERAPAKTDLSYTYWHGKGGGDAPVKEPQVRGRGMATA